MEHIEHVPNEPTRSINKPINHSIHQSISPLTSLRINIYISYVSRNIQCVTNDKNMCIHLYAQYAYIYIHMYVVCNCYLLMLISCPAMSAMSPQGCTSPQGGCGVPTTVQRLQPANAWTAHCQGRSKRPVAM